MSSKGIQIFCPNKISNIDDKENQPLNHPCISIENKERRLRLLVHVFRMDQQLILKVAYRWTPHRKRNLGRSRITWRRTVVIELNDGGFTRREAQKLVKGRHKWKEFIAALYLIQDEKKDAEIQYSQSIQYSVRFQW